MPDEARVADRVLAGEAADDVPRRAQVGEEHHPDDHLDPVVVALEERARDEGQHERQREQRAAEGERDRARRRRHRCSTPSRPPGRTKRTPTKIGEQHDLGDGGLQVEGDDALDAAHEQAADGGARHAADAAEHDDDEDLEQEGRPDPGMHVEERHEHGGRDGHERRAQAVGHAVDLLVVDPHEPRHLAVLPGRADRAPEIGAREEQVEHEAREQHGPEPHQARHADDDALHLEGGDREVGLHGLEVGGEERERDVLEHERQAQRHQEHAHRLPRAVAREQGRHEGALDRVAGHEEQRNGDERRPVGVQPPSS